MNINHAHFAADIQVSNTPMCLWSAVASFIEVLRKLEQSTTKMSSFVAVSSKHLQSVPFQINSWILLFKNVLLTVIVALSRSILCVNKTDEVDRNGFCFWYYIVDEKKLLLKYLYCGVNILMKRWMVLNFVRFDI